MDTSEQYIKMCEKAEEIQELIQAAYWETGDSYYSPRAKGVMMFTTGLGDTAQSHLSDEVWLPRQDQLQEMVGIQDVRELLLPFHRFTHPADGMLVREENFEDVKVRTKYRSLFTSMEQLWLAFVMKEKYNKVWDSKDWV